MNTTKTGKLMRMLPLYIGMLVRLTAKLSAKYHLVQDATETVVGLEFDFYEFPQGSPFGDWRCDGGHGRRKAN